MSVRWLAHAQCHTKWPSVCREFQHPAGVKQVSAVIFQNNWNNMELSNVTSNMLHRSIQYPADSEPYGSNCQCHSRRSCLFRSYFLYKTQQSCGHASINPWNLVESARWGWKEVTPATALLLPQAVSGGGGSKAVTTDKSGRSRDCSDWAGGDSLAHQEW